MPLVVTNNNAQSEIIQRLSSWHQNTLPSAIRKKICNQWSKSEMFFRTPISYLLHKDWSDIVAHLPKAGMITNDLLYPLQTTLNTDMDGEKKEEQCWDEWENYILEKTQQKPRNQYPTPTKEDHRRRGPQSRQQGLPEIVHQKELWHTPTTCELGKSWPSIGQLNPDWVEWLMGFPIGWSKAKLINKL